MFLVGGLNVNLLQSYPFRISQKEELVPSVDATVKDAESTACLQPYPGT